ncbi:uncharacterized protein [Venturia canescens]|uniref:uncharacterized protein n=1 Tax=Venturia canescens TaxID=32260 RepID=UPI001C9CAFB3|nr:uncharacterized protein LOC122413487 [Venturia canescens]
MIFCFICEYEIRTNEELLDHIRFVHPETNVFKCTDERCSRSFSLFKSFRRHRIRCHITENGNISSQPTLPDNLHIASDDQSVGSFETIISEDISDEKLETENHPNISNDSDSDASVFENDDFTASADEKVNVEKSPTFESELLIFVAQLYNFLEIPRSKIDIIVSRFISLMYFTVSSIENDVKNLLHSENDYVKNFHNLDAILQSFISPLKKFDSERRRLNEFKKANTFIEPEQVVIGERQEFQKKKNVIIYKHIPVSIEFISMRNVLKSFFELPYNFTHTIQYIKRLEDSANWGTSNFIQGSLWKEQKSKFIGKIVFPLFMYYDDYEPNNPLGSHRGIAKCGAVYLSIPCLPPEMQSKLENIFLFILFNSLDRQIFSNGPIFRKAIEELEFLEKHGISIKTEQGSHQIYFSLQLILGDNLGLHSLFGLNESFRSNHFCRFCTIHQKDINTVFNERQCKLRDKSSYVSHVENIDPSVSGIKASCTFHQINGYHFLENYSVDGMHDILEGVCQCDLGLLLHHFIYVEKKSLYFS